MERVVLFSCHAEERSLGRGITTSGVETLPYPQSDMPWVVPNINLAARLPISTAKFVPRSHG